MGGVSEKDANKHRQSPHGKFILEPLEPRVLLSADSILGEVYRSLIADEAERDGSQFAVIVEEIDAATSAEIAAADGQYSGSAASESAPQVTWGEGWEDDQDSAALPAETVEPAAEVAVVGAAAVIVSTPEIPAAGTESSLAPDGQDAIFTNSQTDSANARAPPSGVAVNYLHNNDLSLADSSHADEGGLLVVEEGAVSAVYEANLARAPPLTDAELASVLQYALQLWAASGIDTGRLANLQVRIADLPDGQLGRADGLTITLDSTAAGLGWFVDPTSEDFRGAAQIDLLTVLLHEIGHVLGFDHDSGLAVMSETLAAGERVLLGDVAGQVPADAAPVAGALTAASGILTAGGGDNSPITYRVFLDTTTTVNNDPNIPDVQVTGAVTGNQVYHDVSAIIGRAAGGDLIHGDIAQASIWDITLENAGVVTIGALSGITFSNVTTLKGIATAADKFVLAAGANITGLIDGGPGDDTLEAAGTFTTLTFAPTGVGAGSVTRNTTATTYAGLEQITAGSATTVTFTGTAGVDKWFLEKSPTEGVITFHGEAGAIVPTTFAVPAGALTVNLNLDGGEDALALDDLGTYVNAVQSFNGNIVVNAGAGADVIELKARTGTGSYTLNGDAGTDRFIFGQIQAALGQLAINGGDDTDLLVSAPGVAVTLHDASFAAGVVNAALSSIESATLAAPALNGDSTFTGPVSLLTSDTAWTAVGPFTTTGGQVEGMDPQGNPVAGALNIALINPDNPNIAYVASPNGGIWKTTNFLATTKVANPLGGPDLTVPAPTWTPLLDLNQSLSISALTFDPANYNILYAGTGNNSSSNQGGALVGLIKSSDAGATWQLIGTAVFKDVRVNKILVFHGGGANEKLLVATSAGVYRTGLNGENPTKVAGLPGNTVTDMVRLAADGEADAGVVYAAIPGLGVYRSEDFGVVWTLEKELPLSQRIRLAVAGNGTLYVAELSNYVRLTADTPANTNQVTLATIADVVTDLEIATHHFTTMTAAAAAGTNTITVSDRRLFDPGDPITIGAGATAESAKIDSINGTTFTLKENLRNSHAAKEVVRGKLQDFKHDVTALGINANTITLSGNSSYLLQPADSVITFGGWRLVALYKLENTDAATYATVSVPTTTEIDGRTYSLQ